MNHHDPPNLVKLVTRDFMQDPYPALRTARQQAAIPIDSSGMRNWVVTRFDDARKLLADAAIKKDLVAASDSILRRSVVRPERLRGVPISLRRHMLDRDEPDHTRLRGVVSKFFTGRAAVVLRPTVERSVEALLRDLPVGRPVDLVANFARPLARDLIAGVLGIPEGMADDFPHWVNSLLTEPDRRDLRASALALINFITDVLEHKAAEPGDDVLTALLAAYHDGQINQPELVSSVQVLLTGGMEPSNAIANTLHTVLKHPHRLAELRNDPGLLRAFIDESLRLESPFRMLTPRYSTTPVDLGDTVIPEHEMILISVAAANRDPEHFAEPDVFNPHRQRNPHFAFGRGIHRCLGIHLAYLETEIALAALLGMFGDMKPIDDPDTELWQPGIFMRRLHRLPVVLGQRS